MLKLFERTGDEVWLERARLFAMNTVEQVKELEAVYGQKRFSLWTGDIGAALFLHACCSGRFNMPMLDMM